MTTTLSTPTAATPLPSRRRRATAATCFGLPALVVLALGGQLLVTGWTTDRAGGTHHVHDLAWGALEALLLLVPLMAALLRPRTRPSAVLQAVAVIGALLVTMVLVAEPDPFTVVLALLVGGGALAYRGWRMSGLPSRALLVGTAAAAVPLVLWALSAAAAQRRDADEHAELLGYTGVTAFALALVAALAVAALRRPGWRVTAGSVAGAAAVVGIAGIVWPDDASSPGAAGGAGLLALAVTAAVTAALPSAR